MSDKETFTIANPELTNTFAIVTANGCRLEFRPNGDIYWKDRLIESDIDLVTGLRELLFVLRSDAEYKRKLTVIQNIHER